MPPVETLGSELQSRLLAAYLRIAEPITEEAPIHSTDPATFQPWLERVYLSLDQKDAFCARARYGYVRDGKYTVCADADHAVRVATMTQPKHSFTEPFPATTQTSIELLHVIAKA